MKYVWLLLAASCAIGFAFAPIAIIRVANAQHPNIETGRGLVCDTAEQVHQYVVNGQNEEAIGAINAKDGPHSCDIAHVGFFSGEEVEVIHNEQSDWHVTKILIVGVVTDNGLEEIKPIVQYTAFQVVKHEEPA